MDRYLLPPALLRVLADPAIADPRYDDAKHIVCAEATKRERDLLRAGTWDGTDADMARATVAGIVAVRQRQFTRLLTEARAAMRAGERELAKPPPVVMAETPPDTLMEGAS